MTALVALCLLTATVFCAAIAKQVSTLEFGLVIKSLIESGVIRDVVDESDLTALRAAGLIDMVDCPLNTTYFECDADGHVVRLRIAPTIPGIYDLLSFRELNDLKNITVEDFEGYVSWTRRYVASVTVRRSILHEFILPYAGLLVLENVQFTRLNWNVSLPNIVKCDFVNVSLPCPIPDFVLQTCFNRTASTGCWTSPPKIPPMTTFYTRPCITGPCRATCSQPATGFTCTKFFPLTPGPSNVISISYPFLSEAVELIAKTNGTIGQISRIELFDLRLGQWTLALDRPMPARSYAEEEKFKLPAILTNRVNITLEQWPSLGDSVEVALARSSWPERATLTPRQPICDEPVTMTDRSMLDETLADSWCIGRICQRACSNAQNFSFARPVLPLFLVVEGGELWSGATLEATPSYETRVYRLPMQLEAVSLLSTPGLNVDGVRRTRLVGQSATVQDTLKPIVPTRKGMPGVLVKWIEPRRALGATAALNGTSTFEGKQNATQFVIDANASVAFAMSQTFVFANNSLWRGERIGTGARWTPVVTSGELTRLLLNRGEPPARRVLIGLDDGLLAVVSASVRLHDGSADVLLTNRIVQQMSIDVLNVRTGAWYGNILQHDIARNLSDIDVVQWNRSRFGVVDRASGRTSVIEYRPLPYTLVMCSSNQDCSSCIGNIANDEACEWCRSEKACRQAFSSCMMPTVQCPLTTTTTTTTTSTTSTSTPSTTVTIVTETTPTTAIQTNTTYITTNATTSTQSTFAATPESANQLTMTASDSDSSTTIGLAVGISVAIVLLLLGGIGAWYYVSRVKRPAAEDEPPVELVQPPAAPAPTVDSPRSALSREYSDISDVRDHVETVETVETEYNDVDDIRE